MLFGMLLAGLACSGVLGRSRLPELLVFDALAVASATALARLTRSLA